MRTQGDPDMILAAWLDEGPTDLPDATRRAIMTALPTTPQARRGLLAPRRTFPMFTPARAVIAIVVAAIAIGGAISLMGNRPNQGIGGPPPVPTASQVAAPTPTATPEPSPTDPAGTPSPLQGRADTFPVPFTYTIPSSAGLVVSGDTDFWQFRHPAPNGQGYDVGVSVRAVTGGRADPCKETSTARPMAGPQAFVDYFKTIPTVTVSSSAPDTVDGRPAIEAVLRFGAPTPTCPDVWLWAEEGSITQNGSRHPFRLRLLDVDGHHVVILWNDDVPWNETGQAFVESIRFEAPRPSPSTR